MFILSLLKENQSVRMMVYAEFIEVDDFRTMKLDEYHTDQVYTTLIIYNMLEFEQPVEKVDPTPNRKSYRKLLEEFKERNRQEVLPEGKLLKINLGENTDQLTVYNPEPVVIDGQTCIWARVEKRTKEIDSVVILFKEGKDEGWDVVEGAPVFKGLQDPFYCGVIDGYHILGGVQVYEVAGTPDLGYRTVFYRYRNSFAELVDQNEEICDPFAVGPEKMKDIQLIQREKGRIGVFTRPQGPHGQFGGRGRIGYFEIESLDQLGSVLEDYDQKKEPKTLIQGLFIDEKLGDEEWGGANELFILPDGKIGVLGHIAGFDDNSNKKNYYPITFIFNPEDKSVSNVKVIATADQFPPVEVKKSDLGSVIYSCGLMRLGSGEAWLYVGIGDNKPGRILIKDPFGE